jgi:YrbI family 3-deoxy-D-manno-octulosonate 8-phosphate phosphatase
MNIAIIPARGGSKGIPRKNLRMLAGKPLLAHSIQQAFASGAVGRVLVSTDDTEIASVSWQHGAEVVWRPVEISGDKASSEAALLHALDYVAGADGRDPKLVVFLQPTSPLRRAEDIRDAVQTLHEQKADSLFSACPLHGFVWRVENGSPRSFNYNHASRPMRQDAHDDVVENGSIYVFKPWVLRQHQNRLGGRIAVYRMDSAHYYQIDEPEDIEILEALMRIRHRAAVSGEFRPIRLLALDFDGVMTDNLVDLDETGTESVRCSRADGMGIAELKRHGIDVVVLSTERNRVVEARCRKLGIPHIQALDDKLPALREVVRERGLESRQVAYIGNDRNDLECMRWVGLPIAVADAIGDVRRAAAFVASRPGGLGAVREVCDLIVHTKGEVHAQAGHGR